MVPLKPFCGATETVSEDVVVPWASVNELEESWSEKSGGETVTCAFDGAVWPPHPQTRTPKGKKRIPEIACCSNSDTRLAPRGERRQDGKNALVFFMAPAGEKRAQAWQTVQIDVKLINKSETRSGASFSPAPPGRNYDAQTCLDLLDRLDRGSCRLGRCRLGKCAAAGFFLRGLINFDGAFKVRAVFNHDA